MQRFKPHGLKGFRFRADDNRGISYAGQASSGSPFSDNPITDGQVDWSGDSHRPKNMWRSLENSLFIDTSKLGRGTELIQLRTWMTHRLPVPGWGAHSKDYKRYG